MLALTREVSESIGRCELTHLDRTPIDVTRARRQHDAYEETLIGLGCEVVRLPAAHECPDAVFVEDAAVVVPEVAVITRPGAPSRRPETATVAEALAAFRTLVRIEPPATLDGGDVLRLGKRVFVGLSSRSGAAAVEQLSALLGPFGYTVGGVAVRGCLHLKSAVTAVAEDAVLYNPDLVDVEPFDGVTAVAVDPSEPGAANALAIAGTVVVPAAFPRTRRRLEQRGHRVVAVDISELAKAEGAVTCCSILLDA